MKPKRWSKEELKQQILKQLTQTDKGLTWTELQEQFKAIVTLSKALRALIDEGKITAEPDKKDRRITIYKIVPEKAEPDIKRYRIVKFLENMKSPIYREQSITVQNYEVTASCFLDGQLKQKIAKEWKTLNASLVAEFIPRFLKDIEEKGVKISKLALTVTVEET